MGARVPVGDLPLAGAVASMSDEKEIRRRGRPRSSAEPLVPLTVWVSPDEYNKLDERSRQDRVELSPLARKILSISIFQTGK